MNLLTSRAALRRGSLLTSAALVGGLLSAVGLAAAPASAVDLTWDYGEAQRTSWYVPDGVYAYDVYLVGGDGGSGLHGAEGGHGGYVDARILVTPGQLITVDLGQAGADSVAEGRGVGGAQPNGLSGGDGSFSYYSSSGVSAGSGGAGGGASQFSVDGRLAAVAGGGGGGGGGLDDAGNEFEGGRGGDAAHWGSAGAGSGAGSAGAGLWEHNYGERGISSVFGSGGGGGGGGGWPGGHAGGAGTYFGSGGGGAGGANWTSIPGATTGYDTGIVRDGWIDVIPVAVKSPTGYIDAVASPILGDGSATTLRARVFAAGDGLPVPSGKVAFFEGNVALGEGTLVGGVASLDVVFAPGEHAVAATYRGDQTFVAGPLLGTAAFTVTAPRLDQRIAEVGSGSLAVVADGSAALRVFRLTNTGQGPIAVYEPGVLESVGLTATTGSCAAVGGSLAPGASCDYVFAFSTREPGEHQVWAQISTSLSVWSNSWIVTATAPPVPEVPGDDPESGDEGGSETGGDTDPADDPETETPDDGSTPDAVENPDAVEAPATSPAIAMLADDPTPTSIVPDADATDATDAAEAEHAADPAAADTGEEAPPAAHAAGMDPAPVAEVGHPDDPLPWVVVIATLLLAALAGALVRRLRRTGL
ncbi:Ig-like domain-containing protein [Protaetiibacter intestinalis]|uniref:Ig-like domain-containing protein n=1 Tax=Protaetiibacter intestinalis TaxID=2419774 RepID=UPI00187B8C6C|nr:Ig-like domain-containing protein [Protaetiibacter intestinalis]